MVMMRLILLMRVLHTHGPGKSDHGAVIRTKLKSGVADFAHATLCGLVQTLPQSGIGANTARDNQAVQAGLS